MKRRRIAAEWSVWATRSPITVESPATLAEICACAVGWSTRSLVTWHPDDGDDRAIQSGSDMSAVLVVVACIALNAALAGLEIAFVSASRADIRAHARIGDVRVWHFLRLRETPERTLSAIQVGITLVGLLSGAVGGAGAQEFVGPFLQQRLGLGPGGST